MVLSNIYETRAFIALLRHPVNITVLFGRGTHNTNRLGHSDRTASPILIRSRFPRGTS